MNQDPFFPDRGEPCTEALAVCTRCPVTDPCLNYALHYRITEGIWGGTTGRERRRIRSRAA